jgi:hypothetical protein
MLRVDTRAGQAALFPAPVAARLREIRWSALAGVRYRSGFAWSGWYREGTPPQETWRDGVMCMR